jgi:hypothetical protein
MGVSNLLLYKVNIKEPVNILKDPLKGLLSHPESKPGPQHGSHH